ncbi:MAG TPA: hypothetical protein VGY48_07860 [Vicinamibacterales bacterium]|nr:hypothetical protein [Vicinamibacterales bacterium]
MQQLIKTRAGHDGTEAARPPFGPPTPANVYVAADGTVSCAGCDAALATFEAAIFLESILPSGVRVPGGLRYSLARALLDVDAPPYDSLEDFSHALARYERADRGQVVRGLVGRASRARATGGLSVVRRPRAAAVGLAEFRPPLDNLTDSPIPVCDLAIDVSSRSAGGMRRRPSGLVPLATGLAVGLVLISVGEILHSRRTPQAVSVNANIPTTLPSTTLTTVPTTLPTTLSTTLTTTLASGAVEPAQSGQDSVRAVSRNAAAPRVAEARHKPETRRVAHETPAGPRSAPGHRKASFFSRFFSKRIAIRAVPL